MYTDFAPAERYNSDVVKLQAKTILELPNIKSILDAVPDLFLILNDKRQVVFANASVLHALGYGSQDKALGARPGELLACSHAFESKGGCGTTENCSLCGAVRAILNTINGNFDIQECRVTNVNTSEAMDYRIWTKPFKVDDGIFVLFAFADISDEKRRQVLERIFFHDIINTAGGLRSLIEISKEDLSIFTEYKDDIYCLTESLIEEILAQKQVTAAETNEIQTNYQTKSSLKLITKVVNTYKKHIISKNKTILIDNNSVYTNFVTDEVLLTRVLSNMLKNALEASVSGQTVTIGCNIEVDNNIKFWVNNELAMPRPIQLQVFQRSFSTKGSGRGLGTYSIKLLSERYLLGKVGFETNEENGTTFYTIYPTDLEESPICKGK
jgi:signal transduction histidine kinase